jgi:single-strand DNA-binding protein
MYTNTVRLIGYIGNHLSTITTKKGGKRTAIRVATHAYKKEERASASCFTTWHDVIAWDNVADYAEKSFVKGSKVLIEGMIEYQKFKDYHGHIRYVTRIKAISLMNLDR